MNPDKPQTPTNWTVLPDSAFTSDELVKVKQLITVRDEAYKASKIAALQIKVIENQARIRQLEA